MRQWIALAFLPVLLLGCDQQQAPTTLPASSIEVYFSPNGGCTDAIGATLGQAKETILVQAYSFTSAPIAKAVVDAYINDPLVYRGKVRARLGAEMLRILEKLPSQMPEITLPRSVTFPVSAPSRYAASSTPHMIVRSAVTLKV